MFCEAFLVLLLPQRFEDELRYKLKTSPKKMQHENLIIKRVNIFCFTFQKEKNMKENI